MATVLLVATGCASRAWRFDDETEACADFVLSHEDEIPAHYPLAVLTDAAMPLERVLSVVDAAQMWNAKLGEPVFVVMQAGEASARCGWVEVRDVGPEFAHSGEALADACSGSIKLRSNFGPTVLPTIAAHELGHSLGLSHDYDVPGELMYKNAGNGDFDHVSAHSLCVVRAALASQ
jgi:hypothetical protein